MFDTMTLTKTVGSLCGALLVFLLGNWAAESIYSMDGGHGGGHEQGYLIDTGSGDHAEEEVEEGPSFAELMAAADAGKGERVFNKCKACHMTEEGASGAGPHLYGVVGREVGTAEGFSYSGSLVAAADVWTPEALDGFLADPAGYAPGTMMGFAGLDDPEDRANVIRFLDGLDGDIAEMAAPAEDGHDEASAEGAAEEVAEDVAEMSEEETADDAADTADGAADEAAAEDVADTADEAAGDVADAGEAAAENATEEAETATDEVADAAGAAVADEAQATADSDAAADETAEAKAGDSEQDAAGAEFAAMVAAADPAEGEKVYRRCRACHKLEDGKNGVGPHLYGVVGRAVASVEGFNYSDALAAVGGAWTVDQLGAWLESPRKFVPGNKMSVSGLRKEEDRAAIIAYLKSAAE